jgi:signal transduction histidine kinase
MFSTTFAAEQVTVWNIESSIDDALQKRANMVAAVISSDITTDEASYVQVMTELAKQEFPFVPLLLRLISPSGKTIIEFGKVTDPIVWNLDYQLRFPDVIQGRFDNIILEGIEPLRVYTISVSDPRTRQTLALVQAVEALGQVGQTKNRLWRNGIIVGLAGGLLAIAAGLFLLRRGFRPLRTILQTIDEVDYNHLKTRLQKEARPVELEQLAKSLMAMWQRLDMAVSAKQQVIGSASHDLRTPLTALQGQLEVLLLQPSLSAEVRDSLERMLRETGRLVRMVKNLLLNVQLESSPALVAEEVNLKELLDEVVGDIWVLTKGLEFNVVATGDVMVYGDRDLLKQMVLNIVDNAIKFTPKGGQVELTLTSENGWAVLGVSDTGRGIPSEELPHVMEAFYKADISRKSAGEGARLGLAIVKQITDLHGGQIDIQSQERVGTSVKVRLPIRESKGPP